MNLWRRLTLGLWAGVLVTVGAIAAPTLFATLDDHRLAGAVAGRLFRLTTAVSVAAALLVTVMQPPTVARRSRRLAPLVPALLLVLSELGVHPRIAAGPEAGSGEFVLWHALATGLYVLATAVVLALWVAEERRGPL